MSWSNFSTSTGDSVSFFPEATQLLGELDKTFLQFIEENNVFHVKIPSLITEEILEKCGYFSTFPQHLTSITPYSCGCESCLNQRYLTPAACVHIYPMLEKECKINACYTTLERVYRYENGMFDQPERMWEFTVREIVFVGHKDFVTKGLNKVKEKALKFAQTIEPSATLQQAHDLFYPNKENILKQRIQLANNLKDELIMKLDGREIAVSSFNYHQFHFSKPFHFDKEETVVTGCVGFGMERWMLFNDKLKSSLNLKYQ